MSIFLTFSLASLIVLVMAVVCLPVYVQILGANAIPAHRFVVFGNAALADNGLANNAAIRDLEVFFSSQPYISVCYYSYFLLLPFLIMMTQ